MKVLLVLALLAFVVKKPRSSPLPEEEEEAIDFDAENAEKAAAFIAAMTAGRTPALLPRETPLPNVRIPLYVGGTWNILALR